MTAPQVVVVTAMYPSPDRPFFGIVVQREVEALRDAGLTVEVVGKKAGLAGYFGQFVALRRSLRGTPEAVLHAHYGTSGLVAALAAPRRRLVVTVHGSDITSGPRPAASKLWLQYLVTVAGLTRADVVFVQAAFMRALLPGFLRRRTLVVPQPVHASFLGTAPGPREEGELLFLGDGRRPGKGLSLVRAACDCAELGGLRLRSLEEFPLEELPAVMARARLGVLASEKEGLPVACREALGTGLLVVASDLPGIRELQQLVPEGIVVVERSVAALREGIRHGWAATADGRSVGLSDAIRARVAFLRWNGESHLDTVLHAYGRLP